MLGPGGFERALKQAGDDIEAAIAFAGSSPYPSRHELTTDVYA